jgi:hypothetical protein
MNKENEVEGLIDEEIVNEDAQGPFIANESEAYFATKKIFLNGKHYFKDDMLDANVAQSDISFLLNRGLIVLHT